MVGGSQIQRLLPCGGFGHDFEIGLQVDELMNQTSHAMLILRDQHTSLGTIAARRSGRRWVVKVTADERRAHRVRRARGGPRPVTPGEVNRRRVPGGVTGASGPKLTQGVLEPKCTAEPGQGVVSGL